MKRTTCYHAAFSLVELLVSIVVIVILATIAVPIINSSRNSANGMKCAGNLRTLSSGFQAYASANDGNMPEEGWTWPNWIHQLMPTMLGNEGYRRYYPNGGAIPLLQCPQSKEELTLYWHSDYGVNTNILSTMGADGYTGTKPYERYANHGRIILAADFNKKLRLLSGSRFREAINLGGAGEILRHNGMANVVFLDGHVERLGEAELLESKRWLD